jgi:hypothetical protein
MRKGNATDESWRDETIVGALSLGLVKSVEDFFRHNKIRYLYIDFSGGDWKALFLGLLKCPTFDLNESEEVNRQRFEQHLSEYPMLSRIFDMYEYASYEKEEVARLRAECERLKSIATFAEASEALNKLTEGCNQASFNDAVLLLVPD